jgi:hypothetical protein
MVNDVFLNPGNFLKHQFEVAQIYNPSNRKAELGGSRVQGQLGQHVESLSQKSKQPNK